MYRRLTLSLVMTWVACASATGEVVTEYDKFKDITTIRSASKLALSKGRGEHAMMVVATHEGKELGKGQMILSLTIVSRSQNWNYLDEPGLILLVDGERKRYPVMVYEGDVARSGECVESIAYRISGDDLLSLARANRVEGQLGATEFLLAAGPTQTVREVAVALKLMEAAPAPPVVEDPIFEARRKAERAAAKVVSARENCLAKLRETPDYKAMAETIVARKAHLDKARAEGTTGDKMEASREYNLVKDKLKEMEAAALAADRDLSTATTLHEIAKLAYETELKIREQREELTNPRRGR